jgi:hypothetical protein
MCACVCVIERGREGGGGGGGTTFENSGSKRI